MTSLECGVSLDGELAIAAMFRMFRISPSRQTKNINAWSMTCTVEITSYVLSFSSFLLNWFDELTQRFLTPLKLKLSHVVRFKNPSVLISYSFVIEKFLNSSI